MNIEMQYKSIISIIKEELERVDNELFLNSKNSFYDNLQDFLFKPSKRLRPVITVLYLLANGKTIDENCIKIISACELVHNASLIHDDIIDNAETRRKSPSLNKIFGNEMAVVAGDYLLSAALKKVLSVKSLEITELFTNSLMEMCDGEVNQFINKFQVPTFEDYILKSKQKTAALFSLSLEATSLLTGLNPQNAKVFGENFGIAFQIRDDILNVTNSGNFADNDVENGIYNAPVIFAKNKKNPIEGVEKSAILLDNYIAKANESLADVRENVYKQAIIELLELFNNVK